VRRRFKRGSTLRDLQTTNGGALTGFTPRPAPPDASSGIGQTRPGDVVPGSLQGGHYGETRNVVAFSFDDSIDPTHGLDCFFQMPVGTLKIYSAKLWVKPAPFRAYETASTSGGGVTGSSSGGGSTPTSSGGASHNHSVGTAPDTVGTATGVTTDAQGVHNHGGAVGNDGNHSHNVGNHTHSYNLAVATSGSESTHTHTVTIGSHSHTTDTTHSHGITYGIFESGASTGTLSAKVADDGATFGSSVASGSSISAVDIKAYLTLTPGDRQVRIETTGAGAQARVKVLLILDLLIKVDIS